jgi:hypothetical protein
MGNSCHWIALVHDDMQHLHTISVPHFYPSHSKAIPLLLNLNNRMIKITTFLRRNKDSACLLAPRREDLPTETAHNPRLAQSIDWLAETGITP